MNFKIVKNWGGWKVNIFYFFIFTTALMNGTVMKEKFNTLNLNCQNEKMIKIKCQNKNQGFFFSNMMARKIAPKMFSLFSNLFSFVSK